ncbi:sulfite exporter TauE/SafE family protein [Leucobacter chromiireducens]|uniref:sulfite exporter TauE/SafE family protein n=1 Tax=Leucobacter chromiireducens TaxID=283877 RepID=UPI000F640809|nr:sulfite exporter TauE/SafE family protein [Leucobacter chromiireducens]
MEPHLIAIALALAALVGVSLGLLGGGGSILTVPILTYVLGMEPREAIAASLFIVGATSAVSMISHARSGRVRWKTGALFGIAGMIGAFAGGLIGGVIPGVVLMILFAIMMIVTATAMIRGRKDRGSAAQAGDHSRPILRILLDGLLVGIATGLVGAGGGFLIVPALNLLGGLPMAIAVGTSLLVIAMKSFAGLGGYLFSVQLNWPIVLAFTATAIAGSFAGVALAGRIPERALRKGFGVFVLLMGTFVLVQEAPALLSLFASV